MKDEPPEEGEVLPPEDKKNDDSPGSLSIDATIIQQISQYTDRPDILIDVLEKHDPGFVNKLNLSVQEFSERNREKRLRFGERQAYLSLFIRFLMAVGLLAAFLYMIHTGNVSFWSIIGLVLFFAVSQSGTSGISRLTQAASRLVERLPSVKEKNGR